MKCSVVLIFLVFAAHSHAQSQIQSEFNQTFDLLYNETLTFINNLGNALDARINKYIAAYERLLAQLKNVTNDSQLDQRSKDAVTSLITQIESSIANIRLSVNRQNFIDEVRKFADFIKDNFVKESQFLMSEFQRFINMFLPLEKCWAENRQLAVKLITDGLKSASDAATFTINNANLTLNANEALVDSTISLYSFLLSSCDFDVTTRPTCVKSILDLVTLTLPANLNLWASSTADAVRTNAQIADVLVRSAVSGAGTLIGQVVTAIQTCVSNVWSLG